MCDRIVSGSSTGAGSPSGFFFNKQVLVEGVARIRQVCCAHAGDVPTLALIRSLMVAFITCNSSLVPLLEGLCSSMMFL